MDELLKRTRHGFVILLLLSLIITYFMVYQPLHNALRQSALDNFELLATAKYQTIYNQVDRSVEGSMSLSSRTMIREKIYEYKMGLVSFEELVEYTDPKYSDGVDALDRVYYAVRLVDQKPISIQGDVNFEFDDLSSIDGQALTYSYMKVNQKDVVRVISPIQKGDDILGYDVIAYCLDDCIKSLGDGEINVTVSHREELSNILNSTGKGETLYEAGGSTHFVKELFSDAYALVSIQSEQLYLEGDQTSRTGLIAALIGNVILFFIFDLLIVRHARNIVQKAEGTRDHYKNKANIDGLTGAFSRQYLQNWIEHDLEYIYDNLALVMMDIDDFKDINDTYGHSVGDEVLIKLSDVLKKSVRDHDMVIRYGGDEFLLILQTVDYSSVEVVMSRVKDQLKQFGGYDFKLSVSYGVNILVDNSAFESTLKVADNKMYEMKNKKKGKTS